MIDDGDCGAIGGMKIGRGNRSTRRKPASMPLCPPQIPRDLSRARTRAAAVGPHELWHGHMRFLAALAISTNTESYTNLCSGVPKVYKQKPTL
jgi:hypothetical protein